jgi:hypothetical protein
VFNLGLVGLVQFILTVILVFVVGHATDRYDHMRGAQLYQIVEGLTAAFLAWGSFAGWLSGWNNKPRTAHGSKAMCSSRRARKNVVRSPSSWQPISSV